MSYISHESVLYRPDNAGAEKQILSPGDILVETIEKHTEMAFQRDATVNALYVRQYARGNGETEMTFTTALDYPNRMEAERAGEEIHEYHMKYPKGLLYHDYAFDPYGQPTAGDIWIATLEKCDALPLAKEFWFGVREKVLAITPAANRAGVIKRFTRIMEAAWRAYAWKFVLTKED